MRAYDVVMERIEREEVFLYDPFEDLMIRSEPNGGWFVKRRGAKEFQLSIPSTLLEDALRSLEHDHINTKEAYEAFG